MFLSLSDRLWCAFNVDESCACLGDFRDDHDIHEDLPPTHRDLSRHHIITIWTIRVSSPEKICFIAVCRGRSNNCRRTARRDCLSDLATVNHRGGHVLLQRDAFQVFLSGFHDTDQTKCYTIFHDFPNGWERLSIRAHNFTISFCHVSTVVVPTSTDVPNVDRHQNWLPTVFKTSEPAITPSAS